MICGFAITQYHHFDPPFEEARSHDPAGITLLCPNCHAKVTKGLLSAATVSQWQKQPKPLSTGFSWSAFETGGDAFYVKVGPYRAVGGHAILIRDEPAIVIEPPEERGGPYRLSAWFYDDQDRPCVRILRNEWQLGASNWDVTVTGRTLKVLSGAGRVVLKMRAEPPQRLLLKRWVSLHKGFSIRLDHSAFDVTTPSGKQLKITFTGQMQRISLKIEDEAFCSIPGIPHLIL